jgi:transcription antitermination factor NusG
LTWAVVQTEAQREHAVRLLLMRGQYNTYLPRIKVRGRIAPLFPSYLFVELARIRWYPILWTPHVIRLLMAGDRPAQLSEDIVSQIRKRENNGIVKLPNRQFRKGQKVQITCGSFKGYIGLYEGISGKDRQRILLELLGQTVPVELSEKDITPLQVADQQRQCY